MEVQKIVEENKKLKTRLAKYEDTDLLDVTQNRAEADLSYHKDLSKFDPYYGDKSKIYDRNSILYYNINLEKKIMLHQREEISMKNKETTMEGMKIHLILIKNLFMEIQLIEITISNPMMHPNIMRELGARVQVKSYLVNSPQEKEGKISLNEGMNTILQISIQRA